MNRLIVLFCLLTFSAKADTADCTFPPDHPLFSQVYWYGLYYEDTKIGHATSSISQVEDGGEVVIDHRFEMTFKLEEAGETLMQVRHYDAAPPHALIDGHYETADRSIDYAMRGQDLVLEENGAERIWPGLARTFCDEEDVALYQFLEAEPEIGRELVTVDFDVEYQAMLESTHRIEDVSTQKILGADHVFHKILSQSDSEIFAYSAISQYRNGEGVNMFFGPIELRVESEEIAKTPNVGVDLFAEFLKPLDEPLTDLVEINDLELKVRIDDPNTSIRDVVDDRFMQRVEYLDDRTAIVRIGDYPAPVTFDETEKFLKPTSIHPADDPRIQAMADDILAKMSDPTDKRTLAEALLHFVAGYIENVPESPYAYHTTSVFDILDNRTGDCTEHSQLFITLARALGMPARDATGYVYSGDDEAPSLGGHAWVEAFVDGRWIGLDPTWEEFRLNRSHVQTRNDFVLGLSFEVLDINYW